MSAEADHIDLGDLRTLPVTVIGNVEGDLICHSFTGRDLLGARSVYYALCELFYRRVERPTTAQIAERSGFSDQQAVRRHLGALERLGLIGLVNNHGEDGAQTANSYMLLTPTLTPSTVDPDQYPRTVPSSDTPGQYRSPPGGSRAHTRDVAVAVDGRVARDARPSVDVKEKQSSTVPSGGSQSDPPSGPSSSEESFQLQAPPSDAEAEAEQEPLFEAKTVMDNNVQEVWDKFVEVNQPVRKDLSPSQERMLRAALKELTVEEAILCIHGNRLSQWHRERGRHALSDIFKPNQSKRETIRQRADRFIADAVRGGKANQRILSVDRGKVQRHKELVIRAYQPGAGETIRQFGEDSKNWLEEHGIEVRITNDWPRFVEKDG